MSTGTASTEPLWTSRTLDVGKVVHYADYGGQGDRTLVLVHGLGGACTNWAACAPALRRLGRVVAPDLSGFGRTAWRPGDATLDANQSLLGRFLRAISPRPVTLIGNSMGGLLSVMQAAADPSSVEALILACPALLRAPLGSHDRAVSIYFGISATPFVGEMLTRRHRERVPPEKAVNQMLRLCGVDPKKIDPDVLQLHYEIARERMAMPWAVPAYLEAARSLLGRLLFQPRRVEEAMRQVRAPTLLLQGLTDRLVLPLTSRRVLQVCPHWRLDELKGLGHTPMLEAPDVFVDHVASWLK